MAIPVRGVSHGSPGAAFETAKRKGAQRLDFLLEYAKCLWADCAIVNVRADVLFSQWDLETGAGTSVAWLATGNPAGLGIFDDGTTQGLTFVPEAAARAQTVHMCAYLGIEPPEGWKRFDARWQAVIDAGYFGTVATTDDLGNGRWATDPRYSSKLEARHAAYAFTPPATSPAPIPSPTEGPPMALTVKKRMVPTTNRNHPNTLLNGDGDLYIMVHETGNTGAGTGARMHADFVMNGGGSSSVAFHLTVDQTEAYQMFPLKYIGWHASDGCNSRSEDWGCFRSVAIETCVNDGNRYKDATRRNLAELIVMILEGNPAIDFGGIDHRRFSADRIRTHNDAAYDKKWCPTYMLNEGYLPTLRTQVRAKLSGVTPAPVAGFALGDTVEVTESLNLRGGWGTSHAVLGTLPPGTRGTVIADDVGAFTHVNDGYTWINISTPLQPGWVAADWLKKVEAPKPPKPVEYAPRVIIPELAALTIADRDTAAALVLKNGVNFVTVWDEIEAVEEAVNLQFAYKTAKETEARSPKGTRRWASHLFEADDKDHYYYDERGNRLIASQWKRIQD